MVGRGPGKAIAVWLLLHANGAVVIIIHEFCPQRECIYWGVFTLEF